MRPNLLIFALLFASTAVHADNVYKWVDAQGNVLYTDQPRKGAQVLKVATQPASTAFEDARRKVSRPSSVAEDGSRYSTLTFGSPTNEETIRDNYGNVTIALRVAPELLAAKGDQIALTLDGSTVAADVSPPGIVLAGLEQGTHVVQATVTNRSGRVLIRSDPVTFYLKHDSISAPAGPGTYPPVYPPQPYPALYPPQPYKPVYPPSGVPKPGH